uniref:NADH-ubiquinone oxidoreductase chain 6 n=1 Tax=Sceptuchus simplex TaxID=444760 RepID=A0A343UN59_9NEOP|nr:NADH dehydrogenase subunit 6 [Sceptuchus simplex]AVE15709.1 NADH dehydrogenase subunit 6 [Sceptuchus simplex]
MMYILLSISLTLSIIFLFLNHPLSMGLILFLQAISMCLISGSMSLSFWFSYVLLLIYLGGMLVLFMYVTSLASNEMFNYSNKIFLTFFLLPFIILFLYFMNIQSPMNLQENMESNINFNICSNSFLLKMYNQPMNNLTIMIATYLFLTLIAVVKMISIFKGPLRQMN